MKTLSEIMIREPHYCRQKDTLQNVAEEMTRSNIGSLPVIDDNKKVVGVVTDRDVCLALGKKGKNPAELSVQELLANKKLHTVSTQDNVQAALRTMRTQHIRRIPVVDNEKRLQGYLTLNQILRHAHGTSDEAEFEYKGEENVVKTLHAIATSAEEVTA